MFHWTRKQRGPVNATLSAKENTLAAPKHHKEVATYLRDIFGGSAKVTAFRDNQGERPIPIGEFGSGKVRFYSTIGAFDMGLRLPDGSFELAAIGELAWLPNAVASSIYWLSERIGSEWPLICPMCQSS
jgi:hypothetical protein